MPLKTTQVEELPPLNLTSMIDVVFLLLIFFMVAARFAESQQQVGVKLAGGGSMQSMVSAPDQRNVGVGRDGSLTLDGLPITLDELSQRVRTMHAQYPGVVIGINADADASHQTVMSAMRAIQSVANVEMRLGMKLR